MTLSLNGVTTSFKRCVALYTALGRFDTQDLGNVFAAGAGLGVLAGFSMPSLVLLSGALGAYHEFRNYSKREITEEIQGAVKKLQEDQEFLARHEGKNKEKLAQMRGLSVSLIEGTRKMMGAIDQMSFVLTQGRKEAILFSAQCSVLQGRCQHVLQQANEHTEAIVKEAKEGIEAVHRLKENVARCRQVMTEALLPGRVGSSALGEEVFQQLTRVDGEADQAEQALERTDFHARRVVALLRERDEIHGDFEALQSQFMKRQEKIRGVLEGILKAQRAGLLQQRTELLHMKELIAKGEERCRQALVVIEQGRCSLKMLCERVRWVMQRAQQIALLTAGVLFWQLRIWRFALVAAVALYGFYVFSERKRSFEGASCNNSLISDFAL